MRRPINYDHLDKRAVWGRVIVLIIISGMSVAGLLYCIKADRKERNVDKQVQEYEKALPGYLEQKQQVEHFRDSLMRDARPGTRR